MTKEMKSPIKKIRSEMGMSQGEFSMIIGVSKTQIGDLERGTSEISPGIASKLRELLGDNVDGIVEEPEAYVKLRKKELMERFKKSQDK